MTEPLDDYVAWKGWDETEFGQCDANHRRYFDWHVRRAVAVRPALKVAEIGFGNGSFLTFCRAQGWSVGGTELDPQLRARALRAGFPAAQRIDELSYEPQFDLIVLFDVLEHIPGDALIDFMTALTQRVAAHGSILLRVPNGDSPFGRQNQHGDLTHITAFGSSKLRQLAQLCGLKLVAIGEAPWNAQQSESPGGRAWARAVARHALSRLVGFAFYRHHYDLDSNLVAVLVPLASDRPAI